MYVASEPNYSTKTGQRQEGFFKNTLNSRWHLRV